MQKLIVQNFGPIRSLELEVQDIMVFIGPSASGKSTIAKLLHILGNAGTLLAKPNGRGSAEEAAPAYAAQWIAMPADNGLAAFLRASFPANVWQADTYLEFSFHQGLHIKITGKDISININYLLFIKIEKFRKDYTAQLPPLDNYFGEYTFRYFFPAQRSLIASFSAAIRPKLWALTEHQLFPPLTQQYVNAVEQLIELLTIHPELPETYTPQAAAIARQILKGKYQVIRGQEFIIQDTITTPLIQASSGQQETANLVERLLLLTANRKYPSAFQAVIEEPEAHLYPEDQDRLVQLCALAANIQGTPEGVVYAKGEFQYPEMILTTHSPYILTSLNNLIYAHQVGQKHPEAAAELVPQELWLDPARVQAYFVEDGTIRSLIDEETQLIRAEEIDGVSEKINAVFDQLISLDLK